MHIVCKQNVKIISICTIKRGIKNRQKKVKLKNRRKEVEKKVSRRRKDDMSVCIKDSYERKVYLMKQKNQK